MSESDDLRSLAEVLRDTRPATARIMLNAANEIDWLRGELQRAESKKERLSVDEWCQNDVADRIVAGMWVFLGVLAFLAVLFVFARIVFG